MRRRTITDARSLRAKLEWGWGPLALGYVPELTAEFLAHAARPLGNKLVELMWDDDEGVASRAADILERTTRREQPVLNHLLAENKEAMLGLLAEAVPKKLRWNLALMLGRMPLTDAEAQRAARVLESWIRPERNEPSSIVKAAALQGLADLIAHSPALRPAVVGILREQRLSGTAAMRARSRLLLKRLKKADRKPEDSGG